MGVSEALLRIKEVSGVEVCERGASEVQMTGEQLRRREVEVAKGSFGRVCGKGMANVGQAVRREGQLHSLEEEFKVHVGTRRDSTTLVVSGSEANVARCVEVVADLAEEVTKELALPEEQLHALLANGGKYRKAIEASARVYLQLRDREGVRVVGGRRAVAKAERLVAELFRSGCCACV